MDHWTVNQVTQVQFLGDACHFRCDCSWNPSYRLYHCTTAWACTKVTSSSLGKWRHLVLVNCFTACPGKGVLSKDGWTAEKLKVALPKLVTLTLKVRWLNYALVNSTVMIQRENYQHHHHHNRVNQTTRQNMRNIFVFL